MKYRFKKFSFNFFQCVECNFGRFNPLPDRNDILSRYSDIYFQNEYLKSCGATEDAFNPIILKRFDFVYELLKKNYYNDDKSGKVLDIGCGGGFLLKNFKNKGWEVLGLDIIESSVKYSKNVLDINAEKIDFEKTGISDLIRKFGKFDLVVMTDALEHFFDPEKILNKIYSLLNDNGILFISVPNIESISFQFIGKEWAIISPLEHISYFSENSLDILLKNSGFLNRKSKYLQYSNMSNIHKKGLRFYLGKFLLSFITKFSRIAFEGREFYDDIIHKEYFADKSAVFWQGDILIGIAQKQE